jgi:hypothetical protein
MPSYQVFAQKVDQEAVSQIKTCSSLEGIESAIGMHSLTIGAKYPKGSSFRSSSSYLHPYLLGSDIGLGVSLFCLENVSDSFLKDSSALLQTAAATLVKECPPELLLEFIASSSLSSTIPEEFRSQLGSLEQGHFIELLHLDKTSPILPALESSLLPCELVCCD